MHGDVDLASRLFLCCAHPLPLAAVQMACMAVGSQPMLLLCMLLHHYLLLLVLPLQVESMQQQLGQAAADNQVLTAELFALQSALGLPQMLPQPDMSAAAVTAAAAVGPVPAARIHQATGTPCISHRLCSSSQDTGSHRCPSNSGSGSKHRFRSSILKPGGHRHCCSSRSRSSED